jgi:hypothetical protein
MTTVDDAAEDESLVLDATVDVPDDSSFHLKIAADILWLNDADVEAATERLLRLEGDRDLVSTLAAAGFKGREYDTFQNELARYGFAVIRGWIFKGVILQKVRERSFGALPPEPVAGALIEDAESLAGETVAVALKGFHDEVLVPGKWDPAKGAVLRTFFVGQCLLRFSNIYRVWHNEQRRRVAPVDLDLLEINRPGSTAGKLEPPSIAALRTAELKDVLGEIADNRVKAIFWESAIAGRTYAEIGTIYDMTPKAVELAIARARATLKKKGYKDA